jgi:hypothetical protein
MRDPRVDGVIARWLALLLGVIVATHPSAAARRPQAGVETFAARVAALSEPGGYFDTDNLISNERSYLQVIPDLAGRRVTGGAYLGVGPDQNFSYIGHVRPAVAFLVDIRRDNLLLHLLFKALFASARTRVEYLSLLTGRSPPAPIAGWESRSVETIVAHIDRTAPVAGAAAASLRASIRTRLMTFGVPLSTADLDTIDRFHGRFIAEGLSLQFNSTGRAPQPGYPTYRDLLFERDRAGVRQGFLASEAAFQFVKSLQARDLIVPVVGDLAGPTAVRAIGRWLSARGERLSAFYTSNVEFYLFRAGTFGRFVANLGALPRHDHAVVIRSVFGGAGRPAPGYNSASLVQPVGQLVDGYARGDYRQYVDLTIAR